MPDAKIRIESGRNSDGLSMRIVDDVSGETLASFRLDAEEAFRVFGGAHETIDGKISGHLDRVGKTMRHESITYRREGYSADRDGLLRDAEDQARTEHPDWDSYSARFSNDARIIVTMRRWA